MFTHPFHLFLHFSRWELYRIVYVTISRQCLICCLHSVVSSQCIGAELAGVYKPEVDHEWELICRSWDSTWSSGQQMKMENCYHLLGPFKYVQPGKVVRSWWMPHMPAVVDMIKKIYEGQPLCLHLHAPPFSAIIDKQMCAGHPQAQKIACVQNCLRDEVFCLFVGLVQSCFWVQVYC